MKNKLKTLIIDEMHPSIQGMLAQLDITADIKTDLERKQILEIISNYDGLIVRSKTKVDKELLEKAHKLKFVARAGSGLDVIDLNYAKSRNIIVVNAPEGNRDAVAEHTIGMLMVLMHNIKQGDQQIRNYIWDREGNRGFELKAKTFSIIGYGNTGHQVARRLAGFDCEVLAYDKYDRAYSDSFVQEATMENIFEETDVLSLHVPLTTETKFMVNEYYINQFKKPFILINTSRGDVLDLKALINALEGGKIIGACLDVLENEKINQLSPEQKENFDYLIKSNKVILTPHVAGWTKESYIRINEVLVNKIKHQLYKDVQVNNS